MREIVEIHDLCIAHYIAKLVVKEEKKGNPDPIHHNRTVQTCKHIHCTRKMNRTPAYPILYV